VDSLHERAADNLRFIRDAVARAGEFTAVPGWGGVAMGATALVTAAVSGPPRDDFQWVEIWLVDAVVAFTIGLASIVRKAGRSGMPLAGPAARRFMLAFAPPLVAGALLTVVFIAEGLTPRLPGVWLLLYGAGVSSGGALSVRIVPLLGAACMLAGVAAFASPVAWGHLYLATGFGLCHIVGGFIIARKYGG